MAKLTSEGKARIERLRANALIPDVNYEDVHYRFWKRFLSLDESLTRYERYSNAYTYAFENTAVCIDDDELIVGKIGGRLNEEEKADWKNIYHDAELARGTGKGTATHMAIDYDLIMREGTSGVRAKIDGYLAKCNDADKRDFYLACRACLDAVERFSERYAESAEALAKKAEGARRDELLKIAEVCRRVPKYPAKSFWEALQSAHFVTVCLSCNPMRFHSIEQFQLGRLDRWLYPFYKADKQKGILDDATAQLLIDCIGIITNHRVARGFSSGYMVGGRMADGTVVANELTYMGIQAIDDIRLLYPAVGYAHTTDHPSELLLLACEVLSHGRSHPAIFGDDVIAEGLEHYGMPKSDVREYIHSTCVEITPIGASNAWVASPYNNMAQMLLDVIKDDYDSYEDLYGALCSALAARIKENRDFLSEARELRNQMGMDPLLSCFVNDCLERGLDIDHGGARYNWIMPSFVGMANVVDSLFVIKKLIFEEKSLTLAELRAALADNFVGHEELHKKITSRVAKYGNDNDEVDSIFVDISKFIADECKKHTAPFSNGKIIPSVFCFIRHETLGRETGATPDGRVAGFPLGDGSGPCQGREMCGPTASVLSSTKWSQKEFIGGVAVNMKFTKKAFTSDSCHNIAALINTFVERGGFEMQINVVDRETLLAAQENPDAYRDLVVRIGGYSDYFCKLSPQMQAEVLLRTSHDI